MGQNEHPSAKGLLLVNLGSPDSPEAADVRRYLAEFLMDPYVIDIPTALRFLLVHGAILPTRPAKSSAAYRKIWEKRGSPLVFHHEDLAGKVAQRLAQQKIHVAAAMRYGKPSIRAALEKLKSEGVSEIRVFPLYPQYSLAATESSIQKVKTEAGKLELSAKLQFVPAFFDAPAFIRSFASRAAETLRDFKADYVLFSFHGLPERHVRKTDPSREYCLSGEQCCASMGSENRDCYRAQSFATARLLAREMGMAPTDFDKRFSVSFQSRLGRTPWITPFTDLVIPELAKKGVRRLAVMCPSFVADCLETLEEIGIRARESFRESGGEELILIPSLNSSDTWADAVVELMETAVD